MELGAAGATVYVTGRTTREQVSEVGRATETIEETAELVTAAGGEGIAVPTDHLEPEQVRALVERIDREHGRLDILVNDVWGGDHLLDFDTRMWDIDLDSGLRMLRLGVEEPHHHQQHALPLLVRDPAAWSSRSPTARPSPTGGTARTSTTTSPRTPRSGWPSASARS